MVFGFMSGFLRRCHRRGKDGWLPGIAAAQRSGLESRGSWTETRASLWAHHNCAGTSSLAVCSAAGCSPWCLRGLPCKTNIYSGGDSTACQQLLQQLLQCVPGLLLMLIWSRVGDRSVCLAVQLKQTHQYDRNLCYKTRLWACFQSLDLTCCKLRLVWSVKQA